MSEPGDTQIGTEEAGADLYIGAEETGVELHPGTIITQSKQYKVLERLGEGGMGKIYKVFDPIMNRYIALKVMKMEVPESEHRRFRQEARLCGTFMHPNLVRVLEVGTTREHGLFWFAMEYLEGKDLENLIAGGSRPPIPLVHEIFTQTLDALTHVHARNFVHCDIKPANVFVATDLYDSTLRLVKLLDFGVCRDLSGEPPDKSRILGDPFYMPPEQTIPGGLVDHRADIYALGMTFFEVITGGRHPWEDLYEVHPREALRAQREREPIKPSVFLGDLDPQQAQSADDIFVMATAKDPNHRFQTAAAMRKALDSVLG